jgi:hypothetical protein
VQLLPGDAPRLVIASSTRRALVNGQLVPSIAVARAGDEIALEGIDDWRLCLAVYRPAPVGRAGEECSGQECPLCLTRFTPENLVFRCGCGSVLHVGEGHGAADELDCARAAAQCPDCGRAITLESSYEGLNCGETGRQILPRDRSAAVFV